MSTLSVTTVQTANGTTDLSLKTGNSSVVGVVISSSNGNIGLGNATPAFPLHLNAGAAKLGNRIWGTGNSVDSFWIGVGAPTSGEVSNLAIGIAANSTGGNVQLITLTTAGSNRLIVDAGGNVAIGGAASAIGKVGVNTSAGTWAFVANTNTNNYSGLWMSAGGNGQLALRDTNANNMYLEANTGDLSLVMQGVERARFDNAGGLLLGEVGSLVTTGGGVNIAKNGSAYVNLQGYPITGGAAGISTSSKGTGGGAAATGNWLGYMYVQGWNGTAYVASSWTAWVAAATAANGTVPGYITFATTQAGTNLSASDRLLINTQGELQTWTSVVSGGWLLSPPTSSGNPNFSYFQIGHAAGIANGNWYMGFSYGANTIGTITQSTTAAVAYNTTSDYRIKEDVQPLSGSLDRVMNLRPVAFLWKGSKEYGEGFIAHELQEYIPYAVHGVKDAVNDDGSINPQQLDYSKVVVHAIAAIQELTLEVENIKAQLNSANSTFISTSK